MEVNSIIKFIEKINFQNITLSKKSCPNVRYRKICNLCEKYCPTKAIQLSRDIEINEEHCTGCGICASVCPNGVFEIKEQSDEHILKEINEQLATNQSIKFICTKCKGLLGKVKITRDDLKKSRVDKCGFIKVPCLGRVQETFVLYAHRSGAKSVEFATEYCDKDCIGFFQSQDILKQTLSLSKQLIKVLNAKSHGLDDKIIFEPHRSSLNKKKKLNLGSKKDSSTRRKFLIEGINTSIVETLNMTLPFNLKKNKKKDENIENISYWSQSLPAKRLILLNLLKIKNPRKNVLKRRRSKMLPIRLPFSNVTIEPSKCQACYTCTVICPSGALAHVDLDTNDIIYFKFGKCTGCGLCRKACPESAIIYDNTFDLSKINDNAVVLIKHPRTNCDNCKTTFVPTTDMSLCPQCSKRLSIKNAFLQ